MTDDSAITYQKDVADLVLSKMFPIDPFSIVAGGAPRDWYLGKPATDIDVFFYVSEGINMGTVDRMLKAVGIDWAVRKQGHTIPEHYKMNPMLRCVYDVNFSGVPVQIMLMRQPTFKSVLPQFPLSICHTWYKNKHVRAEKPFLRSIRHKAIYKTNVIYNNEHGYVKKILAKFPEYNYYADVQGFAESILDMEAV